jgi:hypothetical protein
MGRSPAAIETDNRRNAKRLGGGFLKILVARRFSITAGNSTYPFVGESHTERKNIVLIFSARIGFGS